MPKTNRRENVEVGCSDCRKTSATSYDEVLPGDDTDPADPSLEFCPFCGSEAISDPAFMDAPDIEEGTYTP